MGYMDGLECHFFFFKVRVLQYNLTAAWLCGPALHLAALIVQSSSTVSSEVRSLWFAESGGCGQAEKCGVQI